MYDSGTQPGVLVSFVTLWPKNSDTLSLILRDTFDAKMLRKWHPGKTNAKYTCQAISPVYFHENVRTFPGNTKKKL